MSTFFCITLFYYKRYSNRVGDRVVRTLGPVGRGRICPGRTDTPHSSNHRRTPDPDDGEWFPLGDPRTTDKNPDTPVGVLVYTPNGGEPVRAFLFSYEDCCLLSVDSTLPGVKEGS